MLNLWLRRHSEFLVLNVLRFQHLVQSVAQCVRTADYLAFRFL